MLTGVLRVSGIFLVAMGTLWALQGLGILAWPAGSLMLAKREWSLYGALTVVTGASILWWAARG